MAAKSPRNQCSQTATGSRGHHRELACLSSPQRFLQCYPFTSFRSLACPDIQQRYSALNADRDAELSPLKLTTAPLAAAPRNATFARRRGCVALNTAAMS